MLGQWVQEANPNETDTHDFDTVNNNKNSGDSGVHGLTIHKKHVIILPEFTKKVNFLIITLLKHK